MKPKIQFQKNAAVVAANGQKVGFLHRIVVNPTSHVLTSLVMRTGSMIHHEEKVIPIDLVAKTTEDQITLHDRPGSLEALDPFEERHLVDGDVGPDQRSQPSPEDLPMTSLGRPDLGLTNIGMGVPLDPGEQFFTHLEQNIPSGTIAIKEGAKVITADGKHAGNIEGVLADSAMDQVTDLLISNGLLARDKKSLPIHWVTILGENEIHLGVKKALVDDLVDTGSND